MQKALKKLRSQVFSVADRYSDVKKRKELEQALSLLEKDFQSGQMQSQRMMVLLRGIMNAQPGTTKVINEFLRTPAIAATLQAGGNFNL